MADASVVFNGVDLSTGKLVPSAKPAPAAPNSAPSGDGAPQDLTNWAPNADVDKIKSLAYDLEAKYGIPADHLIRQVYQESRGNPFARSPAGAQGVSQFMPPTAKQYNVDVNDMASSMDGQARMMADLKKHYGGDLNLATLAYNQGQGNVDKGHVGPAGEDYLQKITGKSAAQMYQDLVNRKKPEALSFDNYKPYSSGLDKDSPTGAAGYGQNDFANSLDSGIAQYKGNFGALAAAFGLDAGKDYYKSQNELAGLSQAKVGTPSQIEDVHNLGDLASYGKNTLASSLPSLIEFAATGFGLGSLGKKALMEGVMATAARELGEGASKEAIAAKGAEMLAEKMGARRSTAGAIGTYPSSVGDLAGNQIDQTGDTNLGYALPVGGIYAAFNKFSPVNEAAVLNGLPKGMAGGLGLRTATGALVGGAQEGLLNELPQTILEQGARKSVDSSYDMTGPQAKSQYLNSVVGGALLGGLPGAVGGAFHGDHAPVSPGSDPHDLLPGTTPLQIGHDDGNALEGELMPRNHIGSAGFGTMALPPANRLPGLPAPTDIHEAVQSLNIPDAPPPAPPGASPTQYVGPQGPAQTSTQVPNNARLPAPQGPTQYVGPQGPMQTGTQAPSAGALPPPANFQVGPDGVAQPPVGGPTGLGTGLTREANPAMTGQVGQQPGGTPIPSRFAQAVQDVHPRQQIANYLDEQKIPLQSKPRKLVTAWAGGVLSSDKLKEGLIDLADREPSGKMMRQIDTIYTHLYGHSVHEVLDANRNERIRIEKEGPTRTTADTVLAGGEATAPDAAVQSTGNEAPASDVQSAPGATENLGTQQPTAGNGQGSLVDAIPDFNEPPLTPATKPVAAPAPKKSYSERRKGIVKERAAPKPVEALAPKAEAPAPADKTEAVVRPAPRQTFAEKRKSAVKAVMKETPAVDTTMLGDDFDKISKVVKYDDLSPAMQRRWELSHKDEAAARSIVGIHNHAEEINRIYTGKTKSEDSYQHGKEGETAPVEHVNDSAERWADKLRGSADPKIESIANRVAKSPFLKDYKVEFHDAADVTDTEGNEVGASISHADKTIRISKESATEGTVLHELFHAAFDNAMARDEVLRRKVGAQMNQVADAIRAAMTSDKDGFSEAQVTLVENALENPREFINYYFNNSDFSQIVDKVLPKRNGIRETIAHVLRLGANMLRTLGLNILQHAPLEGPKNFNATMHQLLDALGKVPPDGGKGPKVKTAEGTSYQRAKAGAQDKSPEAKAAQAQIKSILGQFERVTDLPFTTAAGTVGAKINHFVMKNMTFHQLVERFMDKLPTIKTLDNLRVRMDATVNRITAEADPLFKELKRLSADPTPFKAMTKFVNDSTTEGFRLDQPMEKNRQAIERDLRMPPNLTPEQKDAFIAGKQKRVEARQAEFTKAQREYEAWAKDNKEHAALYSRLFTEAAQTHYNMFHLLSSNIIKAFQSNFDSSFTEKERANIASLLERIHFGERTAEERKAAVDEFNKIRDEAGSNGRNALTDLRRELSQQRKQYETSRSAYFPLMRFGKYLVSTKSKGFSELSETIKEKSDKLTELRAKDAALAKIDKLKAAVSAYDEKLASRDPALKAERAQLSAERESAILQIKDLKSEIGPEIGKLKAELSRHQFDMENMRQSGDDYTVQFFESEFTADAAIKRLKELLPNHDITKHYKDDFHKAIDGVSSAFINKLRANSGEGPLGDAYAAMVTRLYLESLPENNALKRSMAREGIAGYSNDIIRVYSSFIRGYAFNASRLESGQEVANAMRTLEAESKAESAKGNAEAEQVYNTLRAQQAANYSREDMPLTNKLNRLGAFWYLAVSPAFALVNMTQNFIITYPFLQARFGPVVAMKMILSGMKDSFGAYKMTDAFKQGLKSGFSYEPNFHESEAFSANERALFKVLQDAGLINYTQTVELADASNVSDLSTAKGKAANAFQWAQRVSWFLPHHTEIINRTTAALAAYRMAIEGSKSMGVEPMSHDDAVEYARGIVQNTHGDYAQSNKSLMFRTISAIPGGKLLILFRSYQQMMAYAIGDGFRKAFAADLKGTAEQAEARRALVGIFGMQFLVAGTMGLPAAGPVFALAGFVGGTATGEPYDAEAEWRNWLSDTFGLKAGEVLAKGALRAVPGLDHYDLAARLSAADTFSPMRMQDDAHKEGRDQFASWLLTALGPIGSIGANWADAAKAYNHNASISEIMKTAAPKGIADIFKGIDMYEKGIHTSAGVHIDDASATDAVGQALGLRPTKSSEGGEARGAQVQINATLGALRSDIIKQMAELPPGQKDPDLEEARARFAERHPDHPITSSDIIKRRAMNARQSASYKNGRRADGYQSATETSDFAAE